MMSFDQAADRYGISEILLAVLDKDLEKVKGIVISGADVNEGFQHKPDADDFDSLQMDVNANERWGCSYSTMYKGMTALSVASFYGPLEIVRFLVESGASLHPLSYWRRNCLDWAISGDHFEIVKYLLNRNELDVNADFGLVEPHGCNPLYLAVWECRFSGLKTEIVELLLDNGAILSELTYQFALKSNRDDLINLLRRHYKHKSPALGCTCF